MPRRTPHRLFAELLSAETTYENVAKLAGVLEAELRRAEEAHELRYAETVRHELSRFHDRVAEHAEDAELCRQNVLAAGYSPDEYDRWANRWAGR